MTASGSFCHAVDLSSILHGNYLESFLARYLTILKKAMIFSRKPLASGGRISVIPGMNCGRSRPAYLTTDAKYLFWPDVPFIGKAQGVIEHD